SKAADFSIENGSLKFRVRCAEDEPMQACADIASRLLGEVTGAPGR
ncbi:MAG: hypothetical protein INR68_18365, partial [Methylobacterium mesophilicum]|nr:hypothetical protein [Methylobacterium mesophilicum]